METKYTLETLYRVCNDGDGTYIEVCEDADGLGLISINQYEALAAVYADGKPNQSLTFTVEQATLLINALELTITQLRKREANE